LRAFGVLAETEREKGKKAPLALADEIAIEQNRTGLVAESGRERP
jgi:hypothetical protein